MRPITSEQTIEGMRFLFEKDYTTDALSFIDNHHRIINYWGEGVDLLPPQLVGSKRRRFSFFDLVWLGLVKELRDYGMEKEAIAVLKKELLSPPNYKEIAAELKKRQREVEAFFATNYGTAREEIKPMLDEFLSKQDQVQTLGFSQLASYIFYVLGRKTSLNLLVNKKGEHITDNPGDFAYSRATEGPLSPGGMSHLVISLSSIMRFFGGKEYVQDEIKRLLLTDKEWRLIEVAREKGLRSIKVRFKENGEMHFLEFTQKRKIDLQARLSEILIKGAFERVEIETQDGRPMYCTSTRKIKF